MLRPVRDPGATLALMGLLAALGLLLGLSLGYVLAQALGAWPWGVKLWAKAAWAAWTDPLRNWGPLAPKMLTLGPLFWILPAILASLGALFGWRLSAPVDEEIHEAGRELLTGKEALREAQAEALEEAKVSGEGVLIHPQIALSQDRETRHLMILGSTGGGKTVVMLPLIQEAQERGDKLLIYDNKGDFTSSIEGHLFAPWDRRCLAWDVAADCLNRADARRLAEQLIPDTKEPIWADGARAILVALLVMLQQTQGKDWDFKDLLTAASAPFKDLQKIVFTYYPEGFRAVEHQGKTVQSFLINISTSLSHICDLADAWAGRPKWSLRRWILDQKSPEARHPVQTLILQGSGRYKPLRRAYIQAVISTLASIICDPGCPDSRKRRVWLFLDEFKQLGKLNDFDGFLEVGRSKGLRCVLGFQDVAQIREIYSRDTADAWSSMVGSFVVCRTQGVETPAWLSKLIGTRRVLRWTATQAEGGGRTTAYQPEELPVVRPDEITTLLGPVKKGVQAIWFPGGPFAYLLTWPYPPKSAFRPQLIENPALAAGASQAALQAAVQEAAEVDSASETPDLGDLRAVAPSVQARQERGRQPEVMQAANEFAPAAELLAPDRDEPDDQKELDPAEDAGEEMIQELAQNALDVAVPGLGAGLELLDLAAKAAELAAPAPGGQHIQQISQPRTLRTNEPEEETEEEHHGEAS